MTGMQHLTDPAMFERFHKALTSERMGYTPWYFLLSKGLKDPIAGISWKQLEGRLTFEQALKKMRSGYNIGIAATAMDPLCIVDVDDITATPDEIVKPTLSTRSRKRIGRHYFYFTEDPRCKEILTTEGKGEIRSRNEYVVAPGSFVICDQKTMDAMPESERVNAGRYTIENERAPDTITFEEFPPVFLEQAKKNREAEKEAKKRREEKAKARKDKKSAQGSEKNRSAMWDLSIEDIMNIPNKTRFKSLFHESTTGKNTSLNDDGGLTCWRHLCTHTPLSALAVMAGVADCNSAGQGFNGGGSSCIDYTDGATLFKMWAFAKHEGMIPTDDPIPSSALRWYAINQGICKPDDVVDGWKLPAEAYNQAIALIEAEEKVSSGRQRTKLNTEVKEARKAASKAFITIYQDYFDMAEQLQKHNPIHYDSGKNYWVWSWEDRSYHYGDETDILIAIQDAANVHQLTIKSKDKNEMLEAIRITGRRFLPKEVPKNWIQFKDCVVDFTTGEKFDASPEHFFVNPIPHQFGTTPATPTIDRLIKEWVPAENVEMMYEIIAYCLYNRYTIHRVFVLLGAGRNGKSQYMNMIKYLLGGDGWTSTTLEMLVNNQFEGAKLYKKRAAFIGETDFKMIRKTDMLKRLSGDDSVSCQFKGKTPFDFDNYAKLIIGTNSLPETTDTTRGYYSRFVIINFPNEFDEGKPIIDTIPEEEYENLCHKSLLILPKLLEVGKFTNEGSLEERKQRYIKKSSPLTAFLEDYCRVAEDEAEPFWKFYDAYATYAEVNGHRLLSKKAVGQWLGDQGYERAQERWGEKNWSTIYGLSLKEVKQSQLLVVGDVDDVDGSSTPSQRRSISVVGDVGDVDDYPYTLYTHIRDIHTHNCIQKSSTSSTSSTNGNGSHCESVDDPSTSSTSPTTNNCDGVDNVDDSLKRINNAIYRLNYSFGIKEFNVIQLLIKGKPAIKNCTTEFLTEILNSHLEELKIIKLDDKTYKQEE